MLVYEYCGVMIPKQMFFQNFAMAENEMAMRRALDRWNSMSPETWVYYLPPGYVARFASKEELDAYRITLADGVYELKGGARILPNAYAFLPKPKGDHWHYRIDEHGHRLLLTIIRSTLEKPYANDRGAYYVQSLDGQVEIELADDEWGQARAALHEMGAEGCLIMASAAYHPPFGVVALKQYFEQALKAAGYWHEKESQS